MKRPVWLFSMDSEQFAAAPTTTGGLKAYYQHYGAQPDNIDIELVHFLSSDEIPAWRNHWENELLTIANAAIKQGLQPVAGFSFYTWNAAEFLELVHQLKSSCPQLLIVAGGPHVQQAEDYLYEDPIDIIFLGEGEISFTELLDCEDLTDKDRINGLAFLGDDGALIKTTPRERLKDLNILPSALNVIPLTDKHGKPLYPSIAYETSRGCPYRCAFCEWGTGAIGGKMYQFSMERIRDDWDKIIAAGIENIWLADSNFGALKDDLAKAELICDLKTRTGLPSTFATSWSKKHSPRVQEIVLLLNQHGLLPHYQLALQTLTPLALELSNRKNMSANKYEPIAKQMAAAGVPIAAELIWGLPGDNLPSFETNLDRLLATFPNINIFGYTLLPGTEFYEKREQYQIQTLPVAGYGKAKGEYVIGCHTFDRDEGIEGYFLITAHILLIHGCVMPLTTRYLALTGAAPASPLLRAALRDLITEFSENLHHINCENRMDIYEHRAALYLTFLQEPERCYNTLHRTLTRWFNQHNTEPNTASAALKVLNLDHALCPRTGSKTSIDISFKFLASTVHHKLEAMEVPSPEDFARQAETLTINHPGGLGDVLKDPDGGGWMKGVIARRLGQQAQHDTLNPKHRGEKETLIWAPATTSATTPTSASA